MDREEEIKMWERALEGRGIDREQIEGIVDRVSPRGERERYQKEKWQGYRVVRVRDRDEYLDYLSSIDWDLIKARVWARDEGCCRDCGSCEWLQVHHLHYEFVGREWFDNFQSVILVCRWCHKGRHRR